MSDQIPVAVTGMSIMTALGRGLSAQLSGTPAFAEVTRFDTSKRRTHHAAIAVDAGTLEEELDQAIADACAQAGVDRRATPLLLALHEPPSRDFGQLRTYTSACVSATTALADAATLIRLRRVDRVVVAAAYLVEPYQYALFDAGRALSTDGAVRPFSLHRTGTLLGDGVAAVVLQPGEGLAELLAWSRTGDAHHPVQPAPHGQGLTTAVHSALHKANLTPADITYINANATGTTYADVSEAAALTRVFGAPNPGPAGRGGAAMPGGVSSDGAVLTSASRAERGGSVGPGVYAELSEGGVAHSGSGQAGGGGASAPVGVSADGAVVASARRAERGDHVGPAVLAELAEGGVAHSGPGQAGGVAAATPGGVSADGAVRARASRAERGDPTIGAAGLIPSPAHRAERGGRGPEPRQVASPAHRDRLVIPSARRAERGGPAVSSTKGVHGHALEASGLVEFLVTVAALRVGKLPVNAGFLAADPACGVDLILDAPRLVSSPYAMSLNSAFGGANTALVVRVG
ncbi:beta-ketoacyl synthase N-terminal-like domain-containing protein [Kribbella sp. NPDC049584]|uniref:beta-ketoacyl synthase N-terminal-like domain-containing protein n=1 Tax=Kribbella sp. NPDC049584 TaxID=3154833 RepID=UPI00344705D3